MRFKTRLSLTFGLFAFLLCVLFAVLLDESLNTVEDQLVSSLLEQEADYLLARYRESPDLLVLPDLVQLKGYLSGQANIPPWLQPFEPGLHETDDYHVLVRDFDSRLRLYLVYDETSGVLEQQEDSLFVILLLLVSIVSAVGIGLGFYQANVLSRPVENLAAQVEAVDTDKPEIIPLASKDEIGLLSRAYAGLVERLGQYIQREKAFTRYASHELMTPVAVLQNNIELLQNENADTAMRTRAIDRLQQATRQMQRQVEIFLVLAREGQLEPAQNPLDWNNLWRELESHFANVSLTLNVTAEPEIHANEAAVQVILVNILANVMKHGAQEQGKYDAVVSLDRHCLRVSNDVARSEQRVNPRYGFGLEINEKLCAAMGWRFTSGRENDRFSVTIEFDRG